MKLDPLSLKLFISVVEEGTIARAAEREHISAAAVSVRISELEGVLRTELLRRTNKGIEATPAGIALLNLARGALSNLDEIYVQMRDYAAGVRGQVRIFAGTSAIVQFLPGEIAAFLAMHPGVQVRLEESSSPLTVKAVAENAADIGIHASVPHEERLEVFPYRSERLALIAPSGHPLADRPSISFLETLEFQYVGLRTGNAISLLLAKAAADLDWPLKRVLQVTSYDALCHMVQAGLGIGILPEGIARYHAGALRIRAIALEDPWARRELKIGVRSYETLPVAAKLLVDHLRSGL